MRYTIGFLFLWFLSSVVYAGDYPRCAYHYFKNEKIATSECYDNDHRWGKATAFDRGGKVIYEKQLRTIGGHSSVQFSYFDNGAVKRADWSSAPDGGIQWYSSVTTFSEDGKVTGETENDYDHKALMPLKYAPQKKPELQQKEVPKKPDSSHTAYCAVIFSSEFWYINSTRHTLVVTARNNHQTYTTTVKPGDSCKGGEWILAQQFDDPGKYYRFGVVPKGRQDRRVYEVKPSARPYTQFSKEVRRYYFDLVKK
jgi:hypothetical protein